MAEQDSQRPHLSPLGQGSKKPLPRARSPAPGHIHLGVPQQGVEKDAMGGNRPSLRTTRKRVKREAGLSLSSNQVQGPARPDHWWCTQQERAATCPVPQGDRRCSPDNGGNGWRQRKGCLWGEHTGLEENVTWTSTRTLLLATQQGAPSGGD